MAEITGMAGTMQLTCRSDTTQTEGAPIVGQNAGASERRRELNTVRTGAAGSSSVPEGLEACKPPHPAGLLSSFEIFNDLRLVFGAQNIPAGRVKPQRPVGAFEQPTSSLIKPVA